MTGAKMCAWCRRDQVGPRARFCSRKCRQAAFRLRRSAPSAQLSSCRLVMAYADPPYPGLSRKYYGDHPDFAGEVDHAALLSRLESRRQAGQIAGWALSTSSKALGYVMSLVPASAREAVKICSWHKHVGPGDGQRHDFWEPVIVVPGRPWRLGFRNVLCAATARGGHDKLVGRKPILFCSWLFDALGMSPGDELDDIFPGTGGVATAWAELSSRSSTTSLDPRGVDGMSLGARAVGDTSSGAGVAGVLRDAVVTRPRDVGDVSSGAGAVVTVPPSLGAAEGVQP